MIDRRNGPSGNANWVNVGDARLKLTNCFKSTPPLNLKNCIYFAACTYSGPIAMAYSHSTTAWFVTIRMSGGVVLKDKIEIPDVFSMEWTRGHRLLVVDRRGNASLYTALGERVRDFSFDSSIREVRDVKFFTTTHDSGVALLDDQLRLFLVNNVNEPVVWSMRYPAKDPPTAWTVLQPAKERTNIVVVIGRDFYAGNHGDSLTIQDTAWAFSEGQYARISVSPCCRKFAVYHSSRLIQIVTSNLSSELSRITVPGQHPIYRLGWIGDDCIFLQSTLQHMYIFNANDENSCYEYKNDHFHIGVETDGLKVYSNTSMDFFSVVTKEEREVLEVASSSDGALLHEASQLLVEEKSHQSYEYALLVRDLPSAINSCTKVAALSWDPSTQKSLLKAARYGLAFVSSFDTSDFVGVLRELRVLNALRSARIGVPLTFAQYSDLGPACLLNRLIDIAQYGTAIEVCKWLGKDVEEGVDRVLLEWVKRTIQKVAKEKNVFEMDMTSLEAKIADKLSEYPHVSIADAAIQAIEAKLPTLARLLIKREKDESKQVQVLLQLGDLSEALSRAAAAQKPQLMHHVVRHLIAHQKRANYELDIRRIPMAQVVYQNLVREESNRGPGRQIRALLEQASDFERLTMFHLDSATTEINPEERLNFLKQATDSAQKLGDRGVGEALSDMTAFAPSQTERSQDHMTIRDTVIHFAADSAKVNQFKHQCKLSDKQVWLWTIEGLAKAGRLEQLFDMAQKKSPVGYVPFVKACVKYNHIDEAKKYLTTKVNGTADLIQAHVILGNFVTAGKIAYERRDADTLQMICTKAHKNQEAYAKLNQLLKSLQ